MKRKTAIFMAFLMALQGPTGALASLPGVEAAEETQSAPQREDGTGGDRRTGIGDEFENYGETETATPGNAVYPAEPATPSDTQPPEDEPRPGTADSPNKLPEEDERQPEPAGPLDESQEGPATPSNAVQPGWLTANLMTAARNLELDPEGILEIEIHGVVPSQASYWQAELYLRGDSAEERTLVCQSDRMELKATSGDTYVQTGCQVTAAPGRYDLRLVPLKMEGDADAPLPETSYLPYEQTDIEIRAGRNTLLLMNDDPARHGYSADMAGKFGLLPMGDLNDDDLLDEKDRQELMRFVSADTALDTDPLYVRADLNGDGKVDLLDMDAFARYYDVREAPAQAKTLHTLYVSEDEIEGVEDSTTLVGGDGATVKQIFAGTASPEKALELSPANQGNISEDNPVTVSAEFAAPKTMEGFVVEPQPGSGGSIVDGTVTVQMEDGTERTFLVENGQVKSLVRAIAARFALLAAGDDGEMLQGLPVVIDLGGQKAVKKISIQVTKTLSGGSLADISRVEFYDDMADRIPEAPMSIPERVAVKNSDASFSLSWKNMPNVVSYEVTVSGVNKDGAELSQTHDVQNTTELKVESLGSGKLVNGNSYRVEIRSVNGMWRSKAAVVEAKPVALSLPPAPENLVLTGGYEKMTVAWKKMDSTDTYTLYYRAVADSGSGFKKVADIAANQYELKGLKNETEYEIYLTGTNRLGEGPQSLHYKSRTVSLSPPETPNYKLINTVVKGQKATAHVEAVTYGGDGDHAFDVADGDYNTAWVRGDWDAGYSYPGEDKAPIVTLDREYEMDTIVVIPDYEQTYALTAATLYYWTDSGEKHSLPATLRRKTSNQKAYYVFQTEEPFTARRVQLALTNSYGSARRISVAEMKFYYYDPLEHEIMDLYADVYHISLREGVTQAQIDALRRRLNTVDPVSQEYHPKRTELEAELKNAEKILRDGGLDAEILLVDAKDTTRSDSHITFRGGLNTYQPLGVTALAGETLTVYVGGPDHRDGDATRLELILSQYHGSSAAVFKSLGYLKAGANEITVEALDDMDLERGGQLYIEYTGEAGKEQYGVRVSGGHKTAALDLSDELTQEERTARITAYLEEVKAQNDAAESQHKQDHKAYEWDPKNCIYQGTDIVTRYGMISTSAAQVLNGLGGGSIEAMAEKLDQSMKAFDEMVYLFYQHKGLSEDPDAPVYNRVPIGRLNIRYQRMFAGAFMYAGGKHIGIEWPELAGMMGGVPVARTESGQYISGGYFGWGIAHEIGHEINEGAYAVAEVTNNYFSVLAQAHDDNETVRFKYDDVFAKVTSGVKGKANNVFVQLAMYWQLHLAYDLGGYNYKTFDKNEEQLANLFFARADSYARNPASAPGGTYNKLVLDKADTDNKLMRLATAAAQKNLLEFFRRWGLEPDAGTIFYAEQFDEETRGIWFANDGTRAEQLREGAYRNLAQNAAVKGSVSYQTGGNQVTLSLSADGGEDIWMYEIFRYERIKDQIVRRPVGYAYAQAGTAEFTDVIGTVNHRAFTYEAVGYDQWLNPTVRTEIGSVKVEHDGSLDKSLWEVRTNMTNDSLEDPDQYHPDTTEQPGTELMIDGSEVTGFTGSTAKGTDPEIILCLNQEETITGLTYAVSSGKAIEAFEIYVSNTGAGDWTKVKTAESRFTLNDGRQKIYFHDATNLYSYDASYVRLVAKGQGGAELTVSELSLLGQTGDNVELLPDGIGRLQTDYKNEKGEVLIPAGSLIFTGVYAGHPAFNVVTVWDENGKLVGGTDQDDLRAEQIIFAPVPEGNGLLGEVSDGKWVYYIEPQYIPQVLPEKVRVELYRVDDAETNEGERLVSTTLFTEVPRELPEIVLDAGNGGGRS